MGKRGETLPDGDPRCNQTAFSLPFSSLHFYFYLRGNITSQNYRPSSPSLNLFSSPVQSISPTMTKSPNIRHPSFLSLLLLHLLLLHLPKARSELNATTPFPYENYAFPSFNESNRNNFAFRGASDSSNGALQITPDSQNDPETYLTNKSGRVFFKDPFKLWDDRGHPNQYVASFNTTFSINIYRPNNTDPGEGLAFVISPEPADPPLDSDGGYLGLTNATTDGNSSNNFVAVELDTVKESYAKDPDDNHVGLNLNGVVSNITTPLMPLDITIATPGIGTNYTVWIDYNGTARHISVYMAVRGRSKPNFTVLDAPLDISNYVKQWSYFGFSASTGVTYELNCVLDWNITIEKLPDDPDPGWWKWYLIGGLALMALVVAMLLWVVRSLRRKRVGMVDGRVLSDKLRSLPGMPREFKFETLKKATNNFDEKMKLGEGGFGEVYKGLFRPENVTVAVKKFSRDSSKGQDDFLAELTIINCLRHKHLVPLLGEFWTASFPNFLNGIFASDCFKGLNRTTDRPTIYIYIGDILFKISYLVNYDMILMILRSLR